MKSIFIFLFAFLLFGNSVFAKKVEVNEAKKAATSYFQNLDQMDKVAVDLKLVYTATTYSSPFSHTDKLENQAFYYVFNLESGHGFVVISADDAVTPILAYSLEKNYRLENQSDAFVKWMDKYRKEIQEIISKQMKPNKEIAQQWTRLKAGLPLKSEKDARSVTPLLTTTWDQMQYYHDLCPYDNDYNERVATGCVATAMAQVMKYHNYPQNGEGYHTYNHSKYGSLSANFGGTTYNWSSMPNNVTSTNNAVATLMYHVGVSLDMNYGPAQTGGSSTNSLDVVANALKTYFSYSSSTQFTMRENYSNANWISLLKNELDNSRPIEYAGIGQGGGHAFVCDGYDANNYFHFNWGWSGYYDGYFNIDNLNPGTGGTGSGASNYNQYQQIVYGIEPQDGSGGGGASPPGEGSPLMLYSNVVVSPNPIDFYSTFTVSVDIANGSGSDYTCDLTAAIFNADGANVGLIETISDVALLNNYYYSMEFSTEGMPVTPGSYTIGIYSRKSGEEWASVKDGDYHNFVPLTINGPQNDMALYSAMTVSPNPIVQGEEVTVNVNLANYGSDFSGSISADLYTAQGDYASLIEQVDNVSLSYNSWGSATFTSSGLDVEPGTYIVALWDQHSGGNWELMGSSADYPNPITIKVVAPAIQEDPYENNDTEDHAYVFEALNGGHINTDGSTIHVGNDYDYYEYDLDPAYKYAITARVHDSYNSGNGQAYTDDVIFSYNEGNGAGEGYDDVLPSQIIVNGKTNIKFFVASYFVGQTGSYLLDVNIVKKGPAGVEDALASNSIKIYPNPTKDRLNMEFSEEQNNVNREGQVYNAYGQLVYVFTEDELRATTINMDVSSYEAGTYFIRMKQDKGVVTQKFNIIK